MRWVGIMHDYLRRGSNSILIRCSRSSISVAHIRRTLGTRFCTTLPNRIFLVITPCIACCSYATESPATPCFRAFCSYTYSRRPFSNSSSRLLCLRIHSEWIQHLEIFFISIKAMLLKRTLIDYVVVILVGWFGSWHYKHYLINVTRGGKWFSMVKI